MIIKGRGVDFSLIYSVVLIQNNSKSKRLRRMDLVLLLLLRPTLVF